MSAQPTRKMIEQALRATVAELYRADKMEEITLRRIRRRVEEELGLDDGLLKEGPAGEGEEEDDCAPPEGGWAAKSKAIVAEEVVSVCECVTWAVFG